MIEPDAADLGHVIGLLAEPRLEAVAGDDDLGLLGERGAGRPRGASKTARNESRRLAYSKKPRR